MLDEFGFDLYEENEFPLAYLLTFRTYGTWLHGDSRWSVGRRPKRPKESRLIPPNVPLREAMAAEMKQEPVILTKMQRRVVESAIEEMCRERGYYLRAVNPRTNHVHSVVSAQVKPEKIITAEKAYSTRKLREKGLACRGERVWARGKSRRYLWKPRNVVAAIDYVMYCQGWMPFEDWVIDWTENKHRTSKSRRIYG